MIGAELWSAPKFTCKLAISTYKMLLVSPLDAPTLIWKERQSLYPKLLKPVALAKVSGHWLVTLGFEHALPLSVGCKKLLVEEVTVWNGTRVLYARTV
jgi:hypothetical protein